MRNCPQLTECPTYKMKVPLSTSLTKKQIDKAKKGELELERQQVSPLTSGIYTRLPITQAQAHYDYP